MIIKFSIKNLLSIFTIIVLMYIIYASRQILLMVVFGILLAYIVNPVVEKMCKKIPRLISVFIVAFLLCICVILALWWFIPELYKDITALAKNFPDYVNKSMVLFNLIGEKINMDLSKTSLYQYIMQWIKNYSSSIMEWLGGFAGSIKYAFEITLNAILIPVIIIIVLLDYKNMHKFTDTYAGVQTETRKILNMLGDVMSSYFRGQFIVMLILSVLYSIVLKLAGLDAGILLGILTGVLSLVPFLGFTVGIVLSILVSVIQFGDILHPIYVLIGYAIVQSLESFIITPRIVGDSVGLHPIATMVVLLMGGASFGIIGMVFAIPVAAAAFRIYKYRYSSYFNPDIDDVIDIENALSDEVDND